MNNEDISLYSAMQTIKIRQYLSYPKRRFRHESEFAAYARAEMKRLYKHGSIGKKTFRHFDQVLAPDKAGFIQRWNARFKRYSEIQQAINDFGDKTVTERLAIFFRNMQELNFAVQLNHGDQIVFDNEESEKVLKHGFVGMARSEVTKLEQHGLEKDVYITYYLGGDDNRAELTITHQLQSMGFNFYFDPYKNNGRLERDCFAYLLITSFAEELNSTKTSNHMAA